MKVTWEGQLRERRSTQPCDDPGDAVSEIGGSRRKLMRNPDGPERSDKPGSERRSTAEKQAGAHRLMTGGKHTCALPDLHGTSANGHTLHTGMHLSAPQPASHAQPYICGVRDHWGVQTVGRRCSR